MLVRYKISNLSLFKVFVFGADCILDRWPEIKTTGILLKKCAEYYYIVDSTGKMVHDTAFFTAAELEKCLEQC